MSTETETTATVTTTEKKRRGFAAMSPETRKEIASRGGRAAHAQGVGHRFTKEEASEAGRKGGLAPRKRRQTKTPEVPPTSET